MSNSRKIVSRYNSEYVEIETTKILINLISLINKQIKF